MDSANQILSHIAPILTALGTLVASVASAMAAWISLHNKKAIANVHKSTSTMKDELVEAVRKEGKAKAEIARGEGLAQGKKEGKEKS